MEKLPLNDESSYWSEIKRAAQIAVFSAIAAISSPEAALASGHHTETKNLKKISAEIMHEENLIKDMVMEKGGRFELNMLSGKFFQNPNGDIVRVSNSENGKFMISIETHQDGKTLTYVDRNNDGFVERFVMSPDERGDSIGEMDKVEIPAYFVFETAVKKAGDDVSVNEFVKHTDGSISLKTAYKNNGKIINLSGKNINSVVQNINEAFLVNLKSFEK